MLKITDLTASKELESKDMAGVRGGTSPFLSIIDFSTGMTNKVADVTQGLRLCFCPGQPRTVTNNQGHRRRQRP